MNSLEDVGALWAVVGLFFGLGVAQTILRSFNNFGSVSNVGFGYIQTGD